MKSVPRFALLLLLLAGMAAQPCRAELSELQIKSAYIFNFIKFVEWPEVTVKPGSKLRLCVVGNEELRASLAALSGRKVRDHELQIMAPGGDALHACHVLYIDGPEKRRFISIIKALDDAPTLTISDIPGFAERGGNIGLLYRDNKMLFEVNLASTRKVGLQLSGQMLNLAANIFGR